MKMTLGALLIATQLTALPAVAAGPPPDVAAHLQGVLNGVVAQSPDHIGILVSVDAPRMHLRWSGAAGTISRDSKVPLRPEEPFRIASVSKVFVAAAIFRLIEEGRVDLYAPIIRYISPETAAVLESGGYDPKAITVAELLGHTSGLADFGPSAAYDEAILAHQREHKRWTRLEQIEFAVTHYKPIGRPGEKFYYSDTGYVILGEIIERVSGQSMAAYVRQSLNFAALRLHSTYWETLEAAPPGLPPLAHLYEYRTDYTRFDPSFDLWGGGGLVSTTADLDRFFRALLTGALFEQHSTLAMALLPDAPEVPMRDARALLLYTAKFGHHVCWAHEGWWGTTAMYCPDIDVGVATNVDQTLDDDAHGASENRRKLLDGLATVLDSASVQLQGGTATAQPPRIMQLPLQGSADGHSNSQSWHFPGGTRLTDTTFFSSKASDLTVGRTDLNGTLLPSETMDYTDVFLVVHGSGTVVSGSGKTTTLRAGDIVFAPRGLKFEERNPREHIHFYASFEHQEKGETLESPAILRKLRPSELNARDFVSEGGFQRHTYYQGRDGVFVEAVRYPKHDVDAGFRKASESTLMFVVSGSGTISDDQGTTVRVHPWTAILIPRNAKFRRSVDDLYVVAVVFDRQG